MSISYIITVYNKIKYIPGMIFGLKSQEGDFEKQYIFIDDGSTDGSMALVKKLTSGWSNVVYLHQENQGPAIATNNAVKHARCKYLKMVDADDILAPHASSIMLEAANATGSAAVFSMGDEEKEVGFSNGMPVFPEQDKDLSFYLIQDREISSLVKKGVFGSSNAFYNTEAYRTVGGADESIFIQDISIPFRIIMNFTVSYFYDISVFIPENVDARLTSNDAQILHDFSLASLNIIKQNDTVCNSDKNTFARKCTGRSLKWATRKRGCSYGLKYLCYYWLSQLRIPFIASWLIKRSLGAFSNVRRAKALSPATVI